MDNTKKYIVFTKGLYRDNKATFFVVMNRVSKFKKHQKQKKMCLITIGGKHALV